ncbi:MAG: c-type cytochrome, partial [Verrucomicrobiota bacterium]|nr:c-type cytochrome [Verrucomicrobiota bacterium]
MTLGIQGITKSSQGAKWALGMVLVLMSTGAVWAAQSGFSSNTKAVYKAVCATCHGGDGLGMTIGDNRFPSIAGLPKWYLENQLTLFKYDGRGADYRDREGLMMHAMIRALRTDTEVEEMAAYIGNQLQADKSYQPTPELDPSKKQVDIKRGERIYTNALGPELNQQVGCIKCHKAGFGGTGATEDAKNAIPMSPPLSDLEDWYMLVQLEKFIKGVRGAPAKTRNAAKLESKLKSLNPNATLNGSQLMQSMSASALSTFFSPATNGGTEGDWT